MVSYSDKLVGVGVVVVFQSNFYYYYNNKLKGGREWGDCGCAYCMYWDLSSPRVMVLMPVLVLVFTLQMLRLR